MRKEGSHMHGLQAFVLRARALKLYRRALRAAKTAPENQRGVNAPAVVIVINVLILKIRRCVSRGN